jgi:hypothetical protein
MSFKYCVKNTDWKTEESWIDSWTGKEIFPFFITFTSSLASTLSAVQCVTEVKAPSTGN